MAERSSLKPAAISAPTLTPQGQLAGKPAMPLSRPFTLIGSRNRAHLHLISNSISRNHSCIIVTDNGLYLRDLASRTGALVNGRKVKESDLRDGDVIQIGSFKFKFADPAGPVRFPITPKAPGAVLHFHGVNTEIDARTLTIGRRSNCDIPLDDDSVSNTHAIIFESNGERFIRDLGSRTGTLVNGRPIHHQLLNFGDTIRIGSTEIIYNASDADESSHEVAGDPGAERLGLDPIELEPLGLDPIAADPAEPVAPVFPRMVDVSRRIPLDKDPGDYVDEEDSPQPIPVENVADAHSDNGVIPIEADQEESEPAITSRAFADEPDTVEPTAAEPTDIEPVEDVTEAIAPTSFTFVPEDPDTKADSIYAMNFSPAAGIVSATSPIELDAPASEPHEEQAIPADVSEPDIATPSFSDVIEAEPEPVPVEQSPVEVAPTDTTEAISSNSIDVADEQLEDQSRALATERPEEPAPVVAEPVAEESTFTRSVEIEPEAAIDSAPDMSQAPQSDDFTPTLDVITTEAPTAFEGLPSESDAIASAVDEAATAGATSSEEPGVEEAGWTLAVGASEESAQAITEPEEVPAIEPTAQGLSVDSKALPTEVEATTSTTEEVQHPLRPELPPDAEPPASASSMPVAIPPVPGADLLAATGTAAVAASAAVAAAVTKRGRGKAKAEPKPAAPKGGRGKKGTPPAPVVADTPAPTEKSPTVDPRTTEVPPPAPKKRGGSRKKTAPPVMLPPVELEPVETYSVTEAPPAIEDSISLANPPAEPPVEPKIVIAPESSFTTDSTISLEQSDAQDFSGSASMPAIPLEELATASNDESAGSDTVDVAGELASDEAETTRTSESTDELASDAEVAEPGLVADKPLELIEPTPLHTDNEPLAEELEPPDSTEAELLVDNAEVDIDLAPIEVLGPTDPTPESAQVLEPELEAPSLEGPETDETMAGLSLTDTAFGRTVVDLGSADSAPLVEEPAHATDNPQSDGPRVESHHVTAADMIPASGQDSSDLAVPGDDALETAATDTIAEDAPLGRSADATGAVDQIEEVASPDMVDDAPAGEDSIETIGGVELIAPVAKSQTASNVDATAVPYQAPESDAGDDFELPDVDLNFDLSGDDQPGLGVTDTKQSPASNISSSLEDVLEPKSLSNVNVPRPAPVTPAAPAAQRPPAPASGSDPFYGMNRDLASFLGGVPLTLTSATPIAPAAAAAGITTALGAAAAMRGAPTTAPGAVKPPAAPANPLVNSSAELEDDIPEIDFSTTDEPLDLFENAADKLDNMPDALAPISDVSNVLSTGPKPPVAPPPPATPKAVQAPQPPASARPNRPPMQNVTPPPPPRSAPLRSFTGNPNVTPPPMVPGPASPVSFGGAPGAAGLTAPFGAVGTPQTRQVDVFSHTAFPPLDPSVFSAPQRPASPRPVTPGAASQRKHLDAGDEQTSTADDVLAIELDSLPDLNTAPVRRTAIPPNPQTPAARPPSAAAKKPWWKSLKILLPLVIVAIIVVILVVMFLQPKHTVQGTLQIQGLDAQNQPARCAQAAKFRELIQNPHVHDVAIGNLKEQGITPGFLNDPQAVAALADANNSPFESSEPDQIFLKLNHSTTDTTGDKTRMAALLSAIYAVTGAMNDRAATVRQQTSDAHALETDLEKQLQAQQKIVDGIVNQLLASGGPNATNWLLNPQAAAAQVQVEEVDARQAADNAMADVQKKRQALQDAQAAAAPADANLAAESQRVKKAIADLNVRLDAVRLAQAGHADDSAKLFGAALDAMDKALNDAAGGALAPAPVTEARTAVGEIRELDGNLAVKTRDDAKSVAQLRRQIADQRESHLRQIWSGDSSLQAMVEERNAQSHRYGAAIDSNYVDEAAKIKGVLEELDRKIEARRSELATGSQLTDPLQQTLQQTIDRTEAARQAGEAQIATKLQALGAMFSAGGSTAPVSAAPKLSQAASDALVARQAYATASSLSASSADTEARKLQLQIAEQQARLDSLQQEPGNSGPVETARRALDVAQAAEAKATNAFTKTHNNLALLTQLAPEQTKLDAVKDSQKLSQTNAGDPPAAPNLVKPSDASVNLIYARDQRFTYLIGGLAAVLLVFATPLWMTIHDLSRKKHEGFDEPALIEPIHDPHAPALISSDSDSLFAPDTAHA